VHQDRRHTIAGLRKLRNPDAAGLAWTAPATDNEDMAARKRRRSILLVRPPDAEGIGVFAITERKKTKYYTFRQIPCDIGGRGFALHRMGLGDVYHVRIGAPEECSCECLGFLAHGHCKHIRGLLTLDEDGLLAEESNHRSTEEKSTERDF
jgi:hypothetical protein